VFFFLGLAATCFVFVTVLKYVDDGARGQVIDTLAGGDGFGEDLHADAARKRGEGIGGLDPEGERVEVVSRLVSSSGFRWCQKFVC